MNLQELEIRSATDPKFRADLLANPAAVLTQHGMTPPEGVTVKVVESTPTELFLSIPPALSDDELSEDGLAEATGGGTPAVFFWSLAGGVVGDQLSKLIK